MVLRAAHSIYAVWDGNCISGLIIAVFEPAQSDNMKVTESEIYDIYVSPLLTMHAFKFRSCAWSSVALHA